MQTLADLGTDFTKIYKNIRLVGPERFLLRFQKKAREARQCAIEKAMCEAVRLNQAANIVETPGIWRCQQYESSAEESCQQQVALCCNNKVDMRATVNSAIGAEAPQT